MKTIKEEPLELWELAEILEKRRDKKKQFETVEQRRTYEYALEAVRLPKEDAINLLNKLTKDFKIPKKIAAQLVDVFPLTATELEPFIVQLEEAGVFESKEERSELESQIINEFKKYMDKVKVFIEEEEEKNA
ncbi:MAG: hypothetical protein ACP6IP_00495 [Candidatus Njordarchaeia archaeon]